MHENLDQRLEKRARSRLARSLAATRSCSPPLPLDRDTLDDPTEAPVMTDAGEGQACPPGASPPTWPVPPEPR